MTNQFKTFAEASLPPEMDRDSEAEAQLEQLKARLAWFYSRGVQVIIKSSKAGYKLALVKTDDVVVEERS